MQNKGKGGMAVIIGMGGKPESEDEVTFKAPEGFDYSDMKENEEKEVLAKVCYCGDGEMKLVSIDGYPVGESEMEDEEEEEMPEGEMEEEEGEEEMGMPFQERLRQRAGLA